MGLFSQLVHRFSTASEQDTTSLQMAAFQAELQALRELLASLALEMQEHTEKTRRNLESYRARKQPRKDGKFATEDPAQSTLDGGMIEPATHDQIEDLARSVGLIK